MLKGLGPYIYDIGMDKLSCYVNLDNVALRIK